MTLEQFWWAMDLLGLIGWAVGMIVFMLMGLLYLAGKR